MRLRKTLTIIYRRCLSCPLYAALAFSILSTCVLSPLVYTANNCQTTVETEIQEPLSTNSQFCLMNTNVGVSWLKWLSGKSPSIQFHLFDLLELLHHKSDREFTPVDGR
ncbi:hypothetical protein [Alteromonas sp. C1M14]|uniref:hypothetical protein n=1 Tax=Alteromonas sp. C1M14 TaxID=2841567 RepID=UPI001C09ACB2|nr:hypothetical protein [Alteromonas sp. C1M14]MBU2978637.1 hypothetical protein [Alteromonas sp. C1M14]